MAHRTGQPIAATCISRYEHEPKPSHELPSLAEPRSTARARSRTSEPAGIPLRFDIRIQAPSTLTIEQREATDFDEEAVKVHFGQQGKPHAEPLFVCPGMAMQQLTRNEPPEQGDAAEIPSHLGQWPVQLKLVSPTAPYFADADLLLVADCVPFAMGDFHRRFLKGRSIAIGCPKLDDVQFYIEKLAQILLANNLRSLTVVHMEVPCCSGLTHVAREAIALSGKPLDFEDVTVSLQGSVIRTETIRTQRTDGTRMVNHG